MGKRVQHPTGGEKLVQQHFGEQSDINKIMEKHLRSGMGLRPPGNPGGRKPMFVNLTGQSYHEMLCQVQEVQGQFAGLPSRVRKRFANNPEQLIKFLENPENLKEAIKIGLIQEEDLPEDKKAQLDLVREADARDMEEFKEYQRKKRATGQEPELENDEEEERPAKNAGRRRNS